MQEQMTKQDAIETLEIFRNDYTREDSAICRAVDIAIDALRQHTIEPEESTIEPKVRLIDANALMKKICENECGSVCDEECENAACNFYDYIIGTPTIEAEPARHGLWVAIPSAHDTRIAKCSVCGFWQKSNGNDKTGNFLIHNAVYKYCSGCGAKMDGGADNATIKNPETSY